MTEPPRLLSSGSPDVQQLLHSASADAPVRAQLDHLAARLAPAVAAPASAALLPWVLAGVTVLGAVGVIVLGRDRQPAQPAAATEVAHRAEPPVASPPPEPEPPVVLAAPEPVSVPAPARVPAKKRKDATRTEPARQAAPRVPQELELLTPAQAALQAKDFARALELAERHADLYAKGTFAEERETIAIEALHELGQRHRARARFTAFTTRYPHSGYRARLDRTLRE